MLAFTVEMGTVPVTVLIICVTLFSCVALKCSIDLIIGWKHGWPPEKAEYDEELESDDDLVDHAR